MRRLLAAALSALVVSTAAAQAMRSQIPADAKEGKIGGATASLIEIDGKTYRLAPGARIVNQRNLTVTPNMVASGAAARFVLDAAGQVRAVWLVDEGSARTGTGPVERTPAN